MRSIIDSEHKVSRNKAYGGKNMDFETLLCVEYSGIVLFSLFVWFEFYCVLYTQVSGMDLGAQNKPFIPSKTAPREHKPYFSSRKATGFRKLENKTCVRLIRDLETQIGQLTHSLHAESETDRVLALPSSLLPDFTHILYLSLY